MKIPKKIEIVDAHSRLDTMLRFDGYAGYEIKKQIVHMSLKINEILDFLRENPDLRNDIPSVVKEEGTSVIHEHQWKELQRMQGILLLQCVDCGETLRKPVRLI